MAVERRFEITIRVTCLASGSSGNSLLVQRGDHAILIDAGLSARKLTAAMMERGVAPGMLDAILITHEHSDHISGLELLARRYCATVIANGPTLAAIQRGTGPLRCVEMKTGHSLVVGEFEVTSFAVCHDAVEPVGYRLDGGGASVSVFTDLGCVTPELHDPISRSDLVVLEANHDTERLLSGPYPAHLKRRILSERGHLSNRQTAELIGTAMNGRQQTYWLAHLSRTNNTKQMAQNGVIDHLARDGLSPAVYVTDRDRPSLVWER